MSAHEACFNCGAHPLRVAIGHQTTGGLLPLRSCPSCGYWTRTILPYRESLELRLDLRKSGPEIIDKREAA